MQCPNCRGNALTRASYCPVCGRPFTEKEKKTAYKKTFWGKLDALFNIVHWIDLSNITGNIFFRIAVLLILAGLVVFNLLNHGSTLALEKSDAYIVSYNEEAAEYYVETEDEEVALAVYAPRSVTALMLKYYENGSLVSQESYEPGDEIEAARSDKGYYTLTARYEDNQLENILFFVCSTEVEE